MPTDLLKKSLNMLLKRQTNILSAAYIIMLTVIMSQVLGVVRLRLLTHIFGSSNDPGLYLIAAKYPDFIFQVAIAVAITTAFIPVFSDYISKGKEEEAHNIASTLLSIGLVVFIIIALVLGIFAPLFLNILNPGTGFTPSQIIDMTNMMRIIIFAQVLFIIAIFFTALLQSYNHFFVPGFAAALYNVGIIVGILTLSPFVGIYSAAYGNILGALFFVLMQIPLVKKIGFRFRFNLNINNPGVKKVLHLMWPRTVTNIVFYIGTFIIVALISYTRNPGRNYLLFDLAQTLAFAQVNLFGQSIAQAAFPVLSREKDKPEDFRVTFLTSFNQMLYIILPISVLILILRIPIVRLFYGSKLFDWPATVLTGEVLAFFSLSIFSEALIALISRAFYALHNTKILLIVGSLSTTFMICLASAFVLIYNMGVVSIAAAYSIASIVEMLILFFLLSRKLHGFDSLTLFSSWIKFFVSSFFMAFALYIPIKLLDKLVIDTTRTINLIILTGISSMTGLLLYLFLSWLFSVKEASNYIVMFKRLGNWKEVLEKSNEFIDPTGKK